MTASTASRNILIAAMFLAGAPVLAEEPARSPERPVAVHCAGACPDRILWVETTVDGELEGGKPRVSRVIEVRASGVPADVAPVRAVAVAIIAEVDVDGPRRKHRRGPR